MKKKILLLGLIGTILSFVIHFYTQNNDITITTLGDSLALGITPYYIKGYSYNDYLKEYYKINHKLKNFYEFAYQNISISELIYKIKNNETKIIKNKKINIERAINEADILTISIGIDEIANQKITSEIKKKFSNDFNELLNLIKKLNNKKVIVLSLYQPKNQDILTISKLNAIIRDETLSHNFIFLDINNCIKSTSFLNNNHYLNYEAHKKIYELIKNELKTN